MDSNLPEISVEAKRDEKDDEKKRSGLLGLLGWGGKGAAGWSGALGGSGLGGGLLATKAGMIGLILVGSTLAGGIGVVGYKAFGPGSADRAGVKYTSLFAEKTKEQRDAEAAAEAKANGESDSLNNFAKANAGALGKPEQPAASAEAAPTDKAKQDAAAIAAAASASAQKGQANNTNVGGNKATTLKSDKKFGELSKIGGGGAAGSGASFASAGAAAPGHGRASAFSAGPAAGLVKGGSAKGRKFGGAMEQLKAQAGNTNRASMAGAGGVFDGNGGTSGITGDKGGALGGAGLNGGSDAHPTSSPGVGGDPAGNRFAQPPAAPPTNVTPWQAAINTAIMCVAGAALLLYMAGKVAKMPGYGTALAYIMCAVAAALGAFVTYLGSLIGGSFYGQHLQGQMFELAGGAIIVTAAMGAMQMDEMKKNGGPSDIMYLPGIVALGAAAVAYLTPPRKVDSSLFKNGYPPDWDNQHPEENLR